MNRFKTFVGFLDESKTIGGNNDLPNTNTNQVQQGNTEDAILMKIRQYKGTIEDYKNYWDDRAKRNS